MVRYKPSRPMVRFSRLIFVLCALEFCIWVAACDGVSGGLKQSYLSHQSQMLAQIPNRMPLEQQEFIDRLAQCATRRESENMMQQWITSAQKQSLYTNDKDPPQCRPWRPLIPRSFREGSKTGQTDTGEEADDDDDEFCIPLFSSDTFLLLLRYNYHGISLARLLALLAGWLALRFAMQLTPPARDAALKKAVPTETDEQQLAAHALKRVRELGMELGELVITGTAAGLPRCDSKEMFSATSVSDLIDGLNCMQVLPKERLHGMTQMGVMQPRRDAVTGKRQFIPLQSEADFASICSIAPDLNLHSQFGLPAHVVDTLDAASKVAVAAGLQAMRSAQLIGEAEVVLPAQLQDGTGVIFVSSFPALDSLVEEVTKHVQQMCENQQQQMFEGWYRRLPAALQQHEELRTWQQQQRQGQGSYHFNRKLLLKLLVMANSQLAELIKAKGPNMQMNAACAGTSHAVAQAVCWLRSGSCKRVVVIAGDVPTSEQLLPYLSTGFVAMGAASVAPSVKEAALPFNKQRAGMVLGAGAVGLVVETQHAAACRGVEPKCKVMATVVANSAYHPTSLDKTHITQQLQKLLRQVHTEYQLTSAELAAQCLYVSHETFTKGHGGCAAMEIHALAAAFGEEEAKQLLIINSKGYTGHSMGVCFEDVVAVEALVQGVAPAVPNMQPGMQDDSLGFPLRLHKGGAHDAKFALRFAAGFGNQVVYLLLGK